jgi:hypothetical protein
MLCVAPYANALIVSIDGHGEIPEEGMELTITEGEQDILSGAYTMGIKGSVLSDGSLTVTITRSESNLKDEFCCSGQCVFGNQQTSETLTYTTNGIANWYAHYIPQNSTEVSIEYLFADQNESRRLVVHYIHSTEGIDQTMSQSQNTGIFMLNGMRIDNQYADELPMGVYIVNGKKIIKTTHK